MEHTFIFDSVVAHLISESYRTPNDDAIDEAIELLIESIKSNKDCAKREDYLHNIIGVTINENFENGFRTGIRFMTAALSEK